MNDYEKLKKMVEEEEGRLSMVYLDTEGKPTGGIGHLMEESELDSLGVVGYTTIPTMYGPREVGTDKNGTPISLTDEWIDGRFESDLGKAFVAAEQQLPVGAGVDGMLNRLTAVNFQLGENWANKFPAAMKSLQDGDAMGFANNLKYKDINNIDAGFSKYYEQMGGEMNKNNRVDKAVSDATMVVQKQEEALLKENAYKDASAKIGLSWDIVNTLDDLGQVFTPHKKEGK